MERANTLAAFGVQAASNPGRAPAPARKIAVVFVIGTNDPAYSRAQSDSQSLKNAGHPVKFIPIQGAGHCCQAQSQKNADAWNFMAQHSAP